MHSAAFLPSLGPISAIPSKMKGQELFPSARRAATSRPFLVSKRELGNGKDYNRGWQVRSPFSGLRFPKNPGVLQMAGENRSDEPIGERCIKKTGAGAQNRTADTRIF